MRIVTALWFRSLKTFFRNKVQLAFTIVMPFFFIYVFHGVFRLDEIENPVNYMLAGVAIINVFQTALNLSSATITDIVSGFMKEVLVSPVKRIYIALGQLMAAATISSIQGMVVLIIGFFIGLRITSVWTLIIAIGTMIVIGIIFAALGLFLAALIKNAQTFQVMEMAITMPLMFLSGAYIPISALPRAMQIVAYINPMTYTTAFFRTIILERTSLSTEQMVQEGLAFELGNFIVTPYMGILFVLLMGALFLILSAIVFSRVDFSSINRVKAADSDIWA